MTCILLRLSSVLRGKGRALGFLRCKHRAGGKVEIRLYLPRLPLCWLIPAELCELRAVEVDLWRDG